ncbi:RagB/SusD family nutrient uptake outer membrane protein [Chitinophaga qingshengii]|uniref:RagB/SusD family nutrient uptake outer membrane protein n=1 Tax=Chitinophaga qingshengii TaxID=1569794 RepID=A0ABR7TQX8_9BACT|nr:RagB/SusD family nutrient uptake outer membrane protein [Chitinophaga qingshengii]MBC9932867.1 RagB/SusD family nutrient uptake outer membrane protein [Chitinophaga qingshengii]
MQTYHKIIAVSGGLLLWAMLQSSCEKLVSVPDPVNTISTPQVFGSEKQANGAMAGIYTRMINGDNPVSAPPVGDQSFAAGLSTVMGGLSSDELFFFRTTADKSWYLPNINKLTVFDAGRSGGLWNSAYTAIYGANSVIEGIAGSSSSNVKDSVKQALTGEAKFVRAFSYFYLTNFFGDVPLALTIDFNKTRIMPRTPQVQIYQQLVKDLQEAAATMPEAYPTATGERIRPNRYAATALLARVYLYQRDYAGAVDAATAVINHTSLYQLEPDPDNAFVVASKEAIWQLQQSNTAVQRNNATPEGYLMLPTILKTGIAQYCLTDGLMKAFEPGDKRLMWIDSTRTTAVVGTPEVTAYYPVKYKIGVPNNSYGAPPREYYVMLRLAEQYLIRAEAAANGGPGGLAAAIADLNVIRSRAGVPALPNSLSKDQVLAAVAKERQTELFAEWGHRWFDLKRTGKAHEVLSAITLKQPWAGDYQLVYPIPVSEINVNHFLTQNPGY